MKKIKNLFFLLLLINLTAFSNDIISPKTIEINGKYIDLTIVPYGGKDIKLNQLSSKSTPIIDKTVIKTGLKYTIDNDNKHNFFKSKVKVNLLIPQNTKFKYFIKTSNSNISINGINGHFFIDNSKGKISVDNLVGNLNLFNSNKAITLSNIVGDIFIKSKFSKVITKNTFGLLDIQTSHKKIKIKNAEKIGNISTTNASIVAEFKSITPDSKIVTSNHNLSIKIPKDHNFNFSIFGDLISVKNVFPKFKTNSFLILGTSNGTINIEGK